jgi:cytochrome c peroxidase
MCTFSGPTGRVSWLIAASLALVCQAAAFSGDRASDDDVDRFWRAVEAFIGDQTTEVTLPEPSTDESFHPVDLQQAMLGRLLFHDKILSGNMNISCATCHHALTDTGDGLSLSIGEGAIGLGVARNTGLGDDAVHERVPRNAPHLFNLGAIEFERMFHDGRAEVDPNQPSGFRSPAGDDLPLGLNNIIAVQAMFPVTSVTEMAGQPPENSIAIAAAAGDLAGENGVWAQLAQRLRSNQEYVRLFVMAFDDISSAEDIEFVHAANAIAMYEAHAFRFDNSAFDRYLRGDEAALSPRQIDGMELFYGGARCSSCHSGTFQTNHEFAAIAMPQIGPGKGDNLQGFDDGCDDFGRERVTGDPADRFRFRVPTLRNVPLTGPWGHDGAYNTLEAVVRHHLNPAAGLEAYDPEQAMLPSRPDLDAIDFIAHRNAMRRVAIASACELEQTTLNSEQVEALIEFLHALIDPGCLDLRNEVPHTVPSGLPVYD